MTNQLHQMANCLVDLLHRYNKEEEEERKERKKNISKKNLPCRTIS